MVGSECLSVSQDISNPDGPSAAPEQPEVRAMVDDLMDRSGSRRAVNSTAYRIFKLLQWLIESPLTVDALNQRFLDDGNIGKSVSNDSVWLYINTLKALGCVIRRPSPRNGFCYEMISHPFGIELDDRQLETLAQAKIVAQRHFSHQDMLALDGLLKKIVAQGEQCQNPERVENLFRQSRSLDSQECVQRISQIEKAILEDGLLEVSYASPLKGEEVFHFLPESVFYRQGVNYVRGEHPEHAEPSNLRLDRMLSIVPVEDEALRQAMLARQTVKTEIALKVFVETPQDFQGFSLDPNQGVYQENRLWVDGERPHYEVRLQVRDTFYIKQTLLSLGLPFAVTGPSVFRESCVVSFRQMLAFYETKEEVGHGHG